MKPFLDHLKSPRGLITIGVVSTLLLTFIFWPGSGKKSYTLDVTSGMSAHKVADELQEVGFISSKIPFLVWTKLRGVGGRIKVGRYEFSYGRSAFWLVDDLANGRTVRVKVVIPEGFSSWQIAERLEALQVTQAAPFKNYVKKKSLEGYLAPATYDLDYGLSADVVADYLRAEAQKRWTPEYENRAREIGMTKHQVITLASIVEREGVHLDELPTVASVYHNRLKRKMLLQADPTVQYALGYWKKRLLYSDYRKTKSPYNTYLNAGLPPGPICSPGREAVHATLWPKETPYLYFVAKEDGYHSFSVTYREHVNKVNKRNRKKRLKRQGN